MTISILYPASIDNNTSLPNVIDTITVINAEVINRLKTAIIAVETELGVKPSSVYGTVRNRLDFLETVVTGHPGGTIFFGDLTGTFTGQEVIGFYGRPLNNTVPTIGQAYVWDGYAWTPGTAGGNSFTAGQDLSGTSSSQIVIGLYNNPLANTTPTQSAVPVWDTGPAKYDIRPLTQDDILAGFSIISFVGSVLVETGATVTNPSFTASYSSLPNSAQITNTDNINSPLTLITPFTNGTVTGSFHHTSASSTVFTLTAVSTSTKTATQSISWQSRSFGGVGTAGATSATASGSTAVLVGGTGTLSNEGLHSSDVGQTYGPFLPTSQKIYLLLPHTGSPHTFHDQNGFVFVMTGGSPTVFSFTNQNGAVISMDLYESLNLLSTTFTISVS